MDPPGPAQPEPAGPGQWSHTPPSCSSSESRRQSRPCPPHSPGGLGAGVGSAENLVADPGSPPQGQGHTSIHVNAPLEGGKEFLSLKHLHSVRGLGASVPLQQPLQGGIHLGGTPGSEPKAPRPQARPLAPTLLPSGPLSHLVSGQALQQDLLRVPAPLQCNKVDTVQPQPLPGLACQAPNAGFGGVPEPVPGRAGSGSGVPPQRGWDRAGLGKAE